MQGNVIVPLDGSELAEQALPLASDLCRRTGVGLHLVHVRRMIPLTAEISDVDEARAYMDAVAGRLADGELAVTAALIPGEMPQLLLPTPSPRSIAESIVDYAMGNDAALVAMTTHGRDGLSRRWFGSVADAMLRTDSLPVLLVRRDERAPTDDAPRIEHVLVAVAADDAADRAVAAARRFAGVFEPRFTLLRILPAPYTFTGGLVPEMVVISGANPTAELENAMQDLSAHARTFDGDNVEVATRTESEPGRGILAFADEQAVDLIVVGTHARRGIDRLLLGSVADKVVRGAECSVLVVPPEWVP